MRFLYFVLLITILGSCKSRESILYQFDPRTVEEKEITLSDIADDITYILLDNSFPISLIYNPRYFINENIYLSAYQSGVMILDWKGKLIRRIGSIGRGPGEYVHYFNFSVDDKSGTVYVLDARVIKVFSKTGRFLRSIELKEYGEGSDVIEFFNSKIFISCHPQFEGVKYDWIVLDTLGNLLETKKRSIPEFTSGILIGGGVYKFDNRIYSWNPWSDTIFSISPDFILEPSFIISPGEDRLPREDFHKLEDSKLYYQPHIILESNHFIFTRYYHENNVIIAVIDKETRASYSTILTRGPAVIGNNMIGGITNDLDGGMRFQPENYFVENDREYLAGLINPYDIKALVKTDEFKSFLPMYPEKKKAFEDLAGRIKETDNQVLMVVRLKK
ncbi:MAG: 6-bladed beta-propeller [Sedimentibacter sp.]|nr:6-bladed beta-propeller [Sedimentibacter sp.]